MSEIKEADLTNADSSSSERKAPNTSFYCTAFIFAPHHGSQDSHSMRHWYFASEVFHRGAFLLGHTLPELTSSKVPHPVPQSAPPGQEYVDPYLFETGHFESREEYEELSRTAKIKPRSRA